MGIATTVIGSEPASLRRSVLLAHQTATAEVLATSVDAAGVNTLVVASYSIAHASSFL